MQIKKEIFLFCCLVVLTISLLIASSKTPAPAACNATPDKNLNCCQGTQTNKAESPLDFISTGIFHLSVSFF